MQPSIHDTMHGEDDVVLRLAHCHKSKQLAFLRPCWLCGVIIRVRQGDNGVVANQQLWVEDKIIQIVVFRILRKLLA